VGRVKKPFAVNCQADIAGFPFVAGLGVHVGVCCCCSLTTQV
jgi:hypothetical protein